MFFIPFFLLFWQVAVVLLLNFSFSLNCIKLLKNSTQAHCYFVLPYIIYLRITSAFLVATSHSWLITIQWWINPKVSLSFTISEIRGFVQTGEKSNYSPNALFLYFQLSNAIPFQLHESMKLSSSTCIIFLSCLFQQCHH